VASAQVTNLAVMSKQRVCHWRNVNLVVRKAQLLYQEARVGLALRAAGLVGQDESHHVLRPKRLRRKRGRQRRVYPARQAQHYPVEAELARLIAYELNQQAPSQVGLDSQTTRYASRLRRF